MADKRTLRWATYAVNKGWAQWSEDNPERTMANIAAYFDLFDILRVETPKIEEETVECIIEWIDEGCEGLDREQFVAFGPRGMVSAFRDALSEGKWRKR